MTKYLKHFLLSLAVVILATTHSLTAIAGGISIGVIGDLPDEINAEPDGVGGWEFNLSASFTLDDSLTAQPWLKQFVIPGGITIIPGQVFPVWEHLTILPHPSGLVPTDWHEEIHGATFGTPFKWGPSTLIVHNTLEEVTGDISADGQTVDFDPIGTTGGLTTVPIDIWIHKELIYTGPTVLTPGVPPQPIIITVWEEPTVPEPSTLVLAAIGLVGLVFYRRRRK